MKYLRKELLKKELNDNYFKILEVSKQVQKKIKHTLSKGWHGFIEFLANNSGSNMEDNLWIAKNKKGRPFLDSSAEKRL